MARLAASVRARSELGQHEISALFDLYDRYYGGGSVASFRHDLEAKSHVIELREQGSVRGFSTICLQPFETDEERGLAIFSGDTIIAHEYWGEQALARAFSRFAGQVKAAHPELGLYWFLISKGYRTYRYLQAFAQRYYPHPVQPTPSPMRQRMDVLARDRFGAAYLSEAGIVRFTPARDFLRPPWNTVRAALRARAEVRHFLELNPGYACGDELVCIAELSQENLRSVVARQFAEGYRDGCGCDVA